MELTDSTNAWALEVKEIYDKQLADGEPDILLPEEVMLRAPGTDTAGKSAIERLGQVGLTTRFEDNGIHLVPIVNNPES